MVKAGYKQTEIGLIPEDWDVVLFGDVIDYIKGFPFKATDYQTHGIRVIRVSDTTYENIKDGEGIYIDESEAWKFKKWSLKKADLIISTVGSKPPMYDSMVGKVTLVNNKHVGSLLNQNAVIIRSKKQKEFTQVFLYNCFKQSRYLDYIEKIYRGNANQASITLKELFQYVLAFPKSDTEQQAIAEALSDVDALIAGLDKLIAKKRDVKTAVMQQLLTGKKRLPGFNGRWVTKKIGDFAPLQRGFDLPNSKLVAGPHPVVYSNGIVNHHTQFMLKGPGVVTGRSGTLGKVHYVEENYWPHNTTLWVTNFNESHPKYVYYLYSFIGFERFASGSGVPTLNRNDAHAYDVKLPSSVEEQQAIAIILSDIDTEIAALEARRDKTQAIKQGMMQELLTGRTRLL